MNIVPVVLGVAFAAACIWGIVRVVNEPKRCWQFMNGPLSTGTIIGICMVAIGALMLLPAVFRTSDPSPESTAAPLGLVCLIGGIAFMRFAQAQQ